MKGVYYHSTQVKRIAECSKGSILQYFQPGLGYHLSLRSLLCLFLSGRFTQALLYSCWNNATISEAVPPSIRTLKQRPSSIQH